MQTAIIASKKDIAGMNIRDSMLNLFNFKEIEDKFDDNPVFELEEDNEIKLYTTESVQIHAENIDKKIQADLFIFTSRHSAVSGLKTLSCHPIGNFGKAEFGGKENKLCIAPANFQKKALIELNKHGTEIEHEVTLEATHHGPYVEKPMMFVELGSNEDNWKNKEAANIIAKTIIKILIENNDYERLSFHKSTTNGKTNLEKMQGDKFSEHFDSVFVIGGSHYNHVANKVMLKSNYAVGHICAKYNLENLNETLIEEAMEKTMPKAKFVLLDWKGLGKEKQRILKILEENNIKYERSDKFFKQRNSTNL